MSVYLASYTQGYPHINITAGGLNNSIITSKDGVLGNGGARSSFSHHDNIVDVGNFLVTTTALLPSDGNLFGEETSSPPSTPGGSDGRNTQLLQFIVWGVLGSILAVLGFLGNTLSIVVLQRRQMRSSTSYYLLSLAIYDNAILLGMMVYFCLPALAPYASCLKNYQSISNLTIPVGYPLSLAAQMGSIYTCVGFTVERFIAVCRPLHAANTCTKSRTVRAIILIFVWSILYNIPRFFHYQVTYLGEDSATDTPSSASDSHLLRNDSSSSLGFIPCSAEHGNTPCSSKNSSNMAFNKAMVDSASSLITNVISETLGGGNGTPNSTHEPSSVTKTSPDRRVTIYKETEFGSHPTFQHVYLIYSQLFFMFLLPFLVILIMNIGLIRAVKGSKSMHQNMCASARKEHNLTVMLIAVIVVFLVCQFPTIIDNILVAVVGEQNLRKNYSYMCFWIMCTFMVEINAAINFLLYCFFGKKFRMMLLSIFGVKRKQHHVAYRSAVSKSRTNGTNGTRIYDMEVSMM